MPHANRISMFCVYCLFYDNIIKLNYTPNQDFWLIPFEWQSISASVMQVVPCEWTRFHKPSFLMISVVSIFYAIIGVAAILFNSFVVFLYIRSLIHKTIHLKFLSTICIRKYMAQIWDGINMAKYHKWPKPPVYLPKLWYQHIKISAQ